jgi:hypothetical protein
VGKVFFFFFWLVQILLKKQRKAVGKVFLADKVV